MQKGPQCPRHFLQSLEKIKITQSLFPPPTWTVYHGLPLQLDPQIPEGSRSSLANVLLLTCGHPDSRVWSLASIRERALFPLTSIITSPYEHERGTGLGED